MAFLRVLGITLSWAIAGLIFWLCFFILAPLISNAIPAGDWHKLASILVYISIAWFGGVGIPIFIGIAGTSLSIHAGD
jgi:hypothetical protein